ncbi:MAG: hypothetical protein GOV02_00660 [Candidatus Aenigmarchaeota archaeon]|nr:hypothetical protein [Candidatus Aenigmarchaeota archaeon]
MRKLVLLPLVMIMAVVLTAGIVLAGTSSPAGEFTVDDSLYLTGPSYSDNVTLTRNAVLDIVDVTIDSDNVTNSLGEDIAIDPTPSPFTLDISSDNTTEITINATVSGDTPGNYSGTMLFHNGTENETLFVMLDVPIDFSSADLVTFDANFTADADQTFFFNAATVLGVKGIYVSVNDSSATIDVEKGGSNVVSGTEELIYFDYEDGMDGQHTIDISSTGVREITVWLITFEVSDVLSWEDDGDATANMAKETNGTFHTANITFVLNNTGSTAFNVNYTGDSENISSTGGDDIPIVHDLVNQSLGAGTQTVQVQYDMNGTLATDEDVYEGWLSFQLENSGVEVPINVTLQINVTDELNVTIIDVTDLYGSKDDIINASGAYLEVTADVEYYNGTDVGNLMSVDDYFTVRMKTYYTVSGVQKEKTRTTTVQDTALGGPGPYVLNVSVTNADYGGSFTVFTDVTDQNSHTGSANFSTIYINESFFVINAVATGCNGDASCNGDEVDNSEIGDRFYLDVDVKNYGYLDATTVKVVLTHDSCVSLLDDGSWDNDKTITVGNLDAGENLTEEDAWRFRARAAGDCSIDIEGDSHETANWANAFSVDVEVEGDTAGSTGGTSDTSGQLSVYSAPDEIYIDAGSTETITVKVRNTLDADLPNVRLYVDYIDQDWYDGPIKKDVDAGDTVSYTLKFTIPSDAEVKDYSIRFVANTSAVSDKESATLTVRAKGTTPSTTSITPDEELDEYNSRYELLNEILFDAESQGENVTEAKDFLAQVKVLLDSANEKNAAGDTAGAEALYTEINNLLTQSEDSTGSVKLRQLTGIISDWYGILAVGVIILLGGVVYLIRKPSGYTPGQGYSYKSSGKSPVDKIVEKIRRLFKN